MNSRWGVAQADLYAERLGAAAHSLLSNPVGTRPVDFSAIIRRLKAEHHFIYFRPEGGDILVLRVLHEKMDASRHLSDLA
ncbi:MAG: toxin ParE1/3/4 [Sphingomonadales bacterium]|jgi:toxin ParE1/3/4|nr:toxin ParE1/3/4 [Sphingomonadales bacterium]MEA3050729.1 toxin ParE1/3/4 [Sphingomonadales bacterium]